MSGSILLLIHNVGFIIDAVLVAFLICLVYVKDHRTPANRLIILAMAAFLVFILSQLIGVNIVNPHFSKLVLMWNLCNLFISCFLAHFIFLFIGKEKQQRPVIIIFYVVSTVLFVYYIIFPDSFLLDSMPKLFFPNYYVAGSLDWLMRLWCNGIITVYYTVVVIITYPKVDAIMKRKIRYVFGAIMCGYAFGYTAIPLVFSTSPVLFGIYFNPVYSVLCAPIFCIPIVYAILKFNILDITIVAKKAFIYAILVVIVGVFIVLLNLSNEIILQSFPLFPQWILPLVSAVIAVSIGIVVWNKLRESEVLKAEFITVVTHKFRTPLTQIRWATESLSPALSDEDKNNVGEIERASLRLVDLTNLLVQLSDTDSNTDGIEYGYHVKPMRLDVLIDDMRSEYDRRAGFKGLKISFAGSSKKDVMADGAQTRFVLQTIFDNALNYTPKGGSIRVEISEEGVGKKHGAVVLTVIDDGIGIAKEELANIFQKFWRSGNARKADTEGMGIGLFMARRIMERQNGSLAVVSAGAGKGSTFIVKLPIAP